MHFFSNHWIPNSCKLEFLGEFKTFFLFSFHFRFDVRVWVFTTFRPFSQWSDKNAEKENKMQNIQRKPRTRPWLQKRSIFFSPSSPFFIWYICKFANFLGIFRSLIKSIGFILVEPFSPPHQAHLMQQSNQFIHHNFAETRFFSIQITFWRVSQFMSHWIIIELSIKPSIFFITFLFFVIAFSIDIYFLCMIRFFVVVVAHFE